MSGVPSNWETVKLGDISDLIRGLDFPTGDKSFDPDEGKIACLRTANVQAEVEWRDLWFIPMKHVRNDGQIVRSGDILISTANSFELVGKVAQVKEIPHRATLGAFISLIRPSELLNGSFIYYQISSTGIQAAIRAMASTTTNISNVSTSKLRNLELQIAPRDEQDRIVAEIEKQFTRLDAATAALKRVKANLKRYRASVLKAACEGRLVPTEAELARKEGRDYEPADQLLQRILRERRARWEAETLAKMIASGKAPMDDSWKAKYREPRWAETVALRPLPEGWIWATAEQLSDETRSITYGVIKLGQDCESGVPTFRSSDVRHLFLDRDRVKKIAPEIAEPYRRTFLEGGEVLITVRGTLGGVVCAPDDCKGFNISREVAMIAPIDRFLGRGIAMLIAAPELQGWLLQNTSGIAYTGINIERLKALPIPLPPKAELDRIVEKVELIMSVIEQTRSGASEQIRRASRLRESVLRRAFSGKLVAQNTADEPARALLGRILSEREATSKPPARRNLERLVHA